MVIKEMLKYIDEEDIVYPDVKVTVHMHTH